ncbi:MAG: chemotaxis protein CheD [Christensenellales bacterium]|jgi:chemotaxis protein CheD
MIYTTDAAERNARTGVLTDAGLGKTYLIGIAELKIVRAPDKVSTLGLGSCVGLVLYDSVTKIGGMVHIMLPIAPPNTPDASKAKYADTAIPELIRQLTAAGAQPRRLTAKLAGGASMFSTAKNIDFLNVGDRNVDQCKKLLAAQHIRILAEDTGGTSGRSIEFCCETGLLQVRTVSPKNTKML